jgi:rhodanese-related sulfurtransferase
LADNREWLLVLDIREEADTFSQGHISGALLADVNRIRIERDC